jgi:alpha-1,3-mannosylglycoprotein beta-1,4-N-acetylglucosaminyltransferase A/B
MDGIMFGHFYLKISALLISVALTTFWIRTLATSHPIRSRIPGSIPEPKMIVGATNKDATFIFGIPHIHRERQNYIIATLDSLLGNIPESHYTQISYVLLISDPDDKYTQDLIQFISQRFAFYITASLLQMVVPPKEFYPDFERLPTNRFFFGARRTYLWTVKQNYDYAYLMKYCAGKGKYYIQLEDDLTTHQTYIQGLEAGLRSAERDPRWFVVEYSSLGFIGKMFRATDVGLVADFLLLFHAHKPGDWLFGYLLTTVTCRPDESAVQCNRRVERLRYRYTPSLFQHTGQFSSLKGKIQPLQDNEYIPILR